MVRRSGSSAMALPPAPAWGALARPRAHNYTRVILNVAKSSQGPQLLRCKVCRGDNLRGGGPGDSPLVGHLFEDGRVVPLARVGQREAYRETRMIDDAGKGLQAAGHDLRVRCRNRHRINASADEVAVAAAKSARLGLDAVFV